MHPLSKKNLSEGNWDSHSLRYTENKDPEPQLLGLNSVLYPSLLCLSSSLCLDVYEGEKRKKSGMLCLSLLLCKMYRYIFLCLFQWSSDVASWSRGRKVGMRVLSLLQSAVSSSVLACCGSA